MPVFHTRTGRKLATQVEWMRTPQERARGMLKFDVAPKNYAAIFELPWNGFFPLIHTIGMKFPIDVLFCSKEGRVLDIKKNLPPLRLAAPMSYLLGGAQMLLEFSGCDLKDIEIGDLLEWKEEAAA